MIMVALKSHDRASCHENGRVSKSTRPTDINSSRKTAVLTLNNVACSANTRDKHLQGLKRTVDHQWGETIIVDKRHVVLEVAEVIKEVGS
jgi:hypothetical protein